MKQNIEKKEQQQEKEQEIKAGKGNVRGTVKERGTRTGTGNKEDQ